MPPSGLRCSGALYLSLSLFRQIGSCLCGELPCFHRQAASGLRVRWSGLFKGDALSCRASPLPKQSAGLFWNSPLAERTLYENFALCGERRGRCPRPASFFYEKKLGKKPVFSLAGSSWFLMVYIKATVLLMETLWLKAYVSMSAGVFTKDRCSLQPALRAARTVPKRSARLCPFSGMSR